VLLANVLNRAGLDARQRAVYLTNERPEILYAVRTGANDDQPERQHGDIVLVFQLAIHGHERVDLSCGAAEKFAVLDAGPNPGPERC
jgi:hypothetical protein